MTALIPIVAMTSLVLVFVGLAIACDRLDHQRCRAMRRTIGHGCGQPSCPACSGEETA